MRTKFTTPARPGYGMPAQPEPTAAVNWVKVATAELAGRALDFAAAVVTARGSRQIKLTGSAGFPFIELESAPGSKSFHGYHPSRDLSATGFLIATERISVFDGEDGDWVARAWNGREPEIIAFGENFQIAVVRCYVRRYAGEFVEIPEMLVGELGKPPNGPLDERAGSPSKRS
jgi:hypothetical protein